MQLEHAGEHFAIFEYADDAFNADWVGNAPDLQVAVQIANDRASSYSDPNERQAVVFVVPIVYAVKSPR